MRDPSEQRPAEATPSDDAAEPAIPLTFGPTVTLFFSDIRGFTEYTDAHGDAAAFRMLHYHNSMVQEQIALYGGHIVKTLGDSFMVSFNAARNAMACGIGIQKALAQYNENVEGAKIHIGIGINMGEPIRDADDFFGGAVNLAARICAAAGAGQILVSEGVRHVVGKMEGTDYIDRGHFELKGFQAPQHLYEVDWSGLGGGVTAPGTATPRATPPETSRSATAATQPAAAPARSSSRRLLMVVGGVIVALLVVVGGALFVLRQGATEPGAPLASSKPATTGTAPASPSPQAQKPSVASPAAAAKPGQAGANPSPNAVVAAGPSPQAAKPSPPAGAAVAGASPAPASASASPAPVAGGGRLLRADDFSDPARGLFPNGLQGIGRVSGDGPPASAYEGSYAYQDGAIVGRIVGDHPGGDHVVSGRTFLAIDKVFDDFAVEIRARGRSSPDAVRFGVQYLAPSGEAVTFTVFPASSTYMLSFFNGQQVQGLGNGRTATLRPPGDDNLLRVEVRGTGARLFVNGQEIARIQQESLAKRGGQVGMLMLAAGRLTDRRAEVEFHDFKLFTLAP